jgi:hypothetical protein
LDLTNPVKIKMIKNVKLEVALLSNSNGIVALQQLYLVSNLSDKEKESGFVTTPLTVPQPAVIIEQTGFFTAKDNDRVIAYPFTGSWDFFSQ